MLYNAPRGTRDILPDETRRWQYVEAKFRSVCDRFAYEEIRIPTFEHTEVFLRSVGETTDVVQKEMYTFEDKSGRSLTLRPEGTAGVARSFIEQGMSSNPYPVRLYYLLNLFRYERVGKGRYREFNQFGIEAFGSVEPDMDVEVIALADLFFAELGLERRLHINSIGCPECRGEYQKLLYEYYLPHAAELCPDCQQRLERNPLRLIDCKVETCRAISRSAPRLLDYLDEDCRAHFDRVLELLRSLGIDYTIDKDIVRGLDYYTKTVFEFVSENVGTQGTICAAVADTLIETMGGRRCAGRRLCAGRRAPAHGAEAQGRLLELAQAPDLFIALQTEAAGAAALLALEPRAAACELRARSADVRYVRNSAGGSQCCALVLVIGGNELETGTAELRQMASGKSLTVNWRDAAIAANDRGKQRCKLTEWNLNGILIAASCGRGLRSPP